MKCPRCHRDISEPVISREMAALRYMIGMGWLFGGLMQDERWKTDPELVQWLQNGWIEMHPKLGFRITPLGHSVCNA